MEKLLFGRIEDLFKKCDKYCSPVFSDFLDGGQQAEIEDHFRPPAGFHVMLWGGFEEAERRIYGVFPEWEEPSKASFPIRTVRVTHTFGGALSHRDYLGSLLGLGIDRAKTGDIVIADNASFIFIVPEIEAFVMGNLTKVGSRGVSVESCTAPDSFGETHAFEECTAVAASERLDAVLAAILNVSRANAAALLTAGRVRVNHRPALQGAKTLSEGDLLSVQGHGRFCVTEFGANTRSGRMHLTFKKYI